MVVGGNEEWQNRIGHPEEGQDKNVIDYFQCHPGQTDGQQQNKPILDIFPPRHGEREDAHCPATTSDVHNLCSIFCLYYLAAMILAQGVNGVIQPLQHKAM